MAHLIFLVFAALTLGLPQIGIWSPSPVSVLPLVHWSRLNYLDAELFGDKKIVWELNRHQYFCTLGQAYWLTGDERYAQVFMSHVADWIKSNPPKVGITGPAVLR
jgi:hypothetical protein